MSLGSPASLKKPLRFVRTVQAANFMNRFKVNEDDLIINTRQALIKPAQKRTEFDLHTLEKFISRLQFFVDLKKKYGNTLIRQVCKNLYYKTAQTNENVIAMNQPGRTFYVILTGTVSVKIYMPQEEEKSEDRIIELPPQIDKKHPVHTPHQTNSAHHHNTHPHLAHSLTTHLHAVHAPHPHTAHPPQTPHSHMMHPPTPHQNHSINQSVRSPSNSVHKNPKVQPEIQIFEAIEVNTLKQGDVFGELALIDANSKTTANVDAKEPCEFACMEKKLFWDILGSIKAKEIQEKIDFMRSLSFLSDWFDNDLKTLSYHFEPVSYERNQHIYIEGDSQVQYLFVVKTGEILLNKEIIKQPSAQLTEEINFGSPTYKKEIIQKADITVCKLTPGELFGEEGFLAYKQRVFTAVSDHTDTELFRINKHDLEKRLWHSKSRSILGSLIQSKWTWRCRHFDELSAKFGSDMCTTAAVQLKDHFKEMQELLSIDVREEKLEDFVVPPKAHEDSYRTPSLRRVASTPSTVYFNFLEAQKTFTGLRKNKEEIASKIQQRAAPLRGRRPEQAQFDELKQRVQSHTKTNNQRTLKREPKIMHVGSSMPQFASLEYLKDKKYIPIAQKIDNFFSLVGQPETLSSDTSFEQNLLAYAKINTFTNKNIIEEMSKKALTLELEYSKMFSTDKGKDGINNFEVAHYKGMSDNQIRLQYFLKQLKKMRKRLRVLQLIKKGLLKCDNDHFVNEDGEIVLKKRDDSDDEQILNGRKIRGPRFNFIKKTEQSENANTKQPTTGYILEVDDLISDIKSKITKFQQHAEIAMLDKEKATEKPPLPIRLDTNQTESTPIMRKPKPFSLDLRSVISGRTMPTNQPSTSTKKQIIMSSAKDSQVKQVMEFKQSMLSDSGRYEFNRSTICQSNSQARSIRDLRCASRMGYQITQDSSALKIKRVFKYN